MELVSNLVWLAVALTLLGLTYVGVRRGRVALSMATALTLALLIGFILLPVISMSDDLLEARQAALPLSAQTWRMASEGVSAGLDTFVAFALYALLMLCPLLVRRITPRDQWDVRPFAARLARAHRLRPPPFAV